MAGRIRITGMNSGLDTDSMVRELVNAYEKQGEKYTKTKTKTEWKQEAWDTLNGKIKSFYSKYASNMRFSSAYNKKKTTVSDPSKATIVTSDGAVNGTQTLKINKLAKAGYLTGGELKTDASGKAVTGKTTLGDLGFEGSATIKIGNENPKSFEIDSSTTMDEFAKMASAAGYNANFDAGTGRFFISSKESGAANDFNISSDTVDGNIAIAKLGLQTEDYYSELGGLQGTKLENLAKKAASERGVEYSEDILNEFRKLRNDALAASKIENNNAFAHKIDGEDAEIELNGATFKSANNSFSINGLTITAKEVSTSEMSIVTDTDYDDIYDTIKDFFKEYNSLMNEMDKLYNAKSAKGYEPLTAEEKEEMTEDEIEKWETKIKDALLKNDSDLDSIASAMRGAMLSTFKIDGQTYSLSSFGINTLGYFEAPDNEKNAFHIDGDSDDANVSGNPDKLRAMIASDPSTTAKFFQELSGKLYDAMNKIQSVSDNYKSYGNFYGDKKLKSEYDDQTKQVEKWEKYVADQEDKYYKQFSAMESAMSSLQSQQSYISQLFGMGQ